MAVAFCVVITAGCIGSTDGKEGQQPLEGSFVLRSSILNEERICLVDLPASYAKDPGRRYPLLILLDGRAHYETTIVALDSLRGGIGNTFPEMIVVAIENVDRERDFTVTKIKTKRKNTMGGGKRFLDFIETELIPYVDDRYRTKAERIFVGHSLAGLLGVNAYMDEKRIFDAYICLDPSIWWEQQMIEEKVAAIEKEAFRNKLYIATANQGEAKQGKNKSRHELLYHLMKEKSAYPDHLSIQYFEDEDHRSVPRVAIYDGLNLLYGDRRE